ncbi:hypothetical protein [Scandinavium sp.]|uniref:hypothetical protein n=1 Tax=Scandinavium sp. TaxID=2830653 RepID=UPI0028991845|nr:hypothetical protein [Scandinavium sp.]
MVTAVNTQAPRVAQLEFNESQKTANIQQETRNPQSMSAMVTEEGMLSVLNDKLSLRTDSVRANAAQASAANVNAESAMPTVTLSVAGEGDANKAKLLADAAPAAMMSQTNITQPNNKSADSRSAVDAAGGTSAPSAGQKRTLPAVEGGTDVTGASAAKRVRTEETDSTTTQAASRKRAHSADEGADNAAPAKRAFVNVVGPMNQLILNNKLTVALRDSENSQNLQAAKASERFIKSTAISAQKGVDAAEERRDGAIVGGVTSAVAQGGMAVASTRALQKENNSLNNNVRVAKNQEFGVAAHGSSIGNAGDSMIQKGARSMDNKLKDTLSEPHANEMLKAGNKHINHSEVVNHTQKVRVVTELGNQLANTTRNITEGAYNVNAAEKQGESDLARADGTLNTELANTHSQGAKKAAETRAALNQASENVLNTNNGAASSIAERMR